MGISYRKCKYECHLADIQKVVAAAPWSRPLERHTWDLFSSKNIAVNGRSVLYIENGSIVIENGSGKEETDFPAIGS